MNISLTGIVNDYLTQAKEKREVTSWQCAKLGSCLTGVYLERLGLKPDTEFDERTLRVFSAGHKFEEWILEIAEKNLKDANIERQVRVEDEKLGFSGYADAVFEKDGEKVLFEVKSKNSRAFWYMEKKKEGANHHHKMQTWLYLYGLNIDKGILAYIEKDTLTMLEYPVFLNDIELEKEVMGELDILNRAWKAKLPPPVPEYEKGDWRPKYCRYHKQCVTQSEYLNQPNHD